MQATTLECTVFSHLHIYESRRRSMPCKFFLLFYYFI